MRKKGGKKRRIEKVRRSKEAQQRRSKEAQQRMAKNLFLSISIFLVLLLTTTRAFSRIPTRLSYCYNRARVLQVHARAGADNDNDNDDIPPPPPMTGGGEWADWDNGR